MMIRPKRNPWSSITLPIFLVLEVFLLWSLGGTRTAATVTQAAIAFYIAHLTTATKQLRLLNHYDMRHRMLINFLFHIVVLFNHDFFTIIHIYAADGMQCSIEGSIKSNNGGFCILFTTDRHPVVSAQVDVIAQRHRLAAEVLAVVYHVGELRQLGGGADGKILANSRNVTPPFYVF